jgi:hypothetical protein
MPMEQLRRGNRINFELERGREVGLQWEFQRRHRCVDRLFFRRFIQGQGTAGFRQQIKQPLGHFFIERSQDGQQVGFAPLL